MRQSSHKIDRQDLLTKLNGEFRAPLFNFFYRRVSHATIAEDLTQDTFARLIAIALQDEIGDPGALLFRIAGNLLKDHYKKAHRRSQASLGDLDPPPISNISREFIEDQDPERVLIAKERVAAVVKALGELSERTRAMYILFRLENMTQAAIAELFGVSKSTVEKSIAKVSLHLMKRVGPEPH